LHSLLGRSLRRLQSLRRVSRGLGGIVRPPFHLDQTQSVTIGRRLEHCLLALFGHYPLFVTPLPVDSNALDCRIRCLDFLLGLSDATLRATKCPFGLARVYGSCTTY
jgi:hypothetical protein